MIPPANAFVGITPSPVHSTRSPFLSSSDSSHVKKIRAIHFPAASASTDQSSSSLKDVADTVMESLTPSTVKDLTRICKVQVAHVAHVGVERRLGLVATQSVQKGEVVLAMPYDYELSGEVGKNVFRGILPDEYDSWTGDVGWIALLLLNEVARGSSDKNAGIDKPKRSPNIQNFITSWLQALPQPVELLHHPLLWSEQDQEVLQSSSTNKIYRQLDDLEEDISWLKTNVFDKDRATFPETVEWNGKRFDCFNLQGFKWAMALARSRSFFLDGRLRLLPLLDFCNHSDDAEEVRAGSVGIAFGSTKAAQIVAADNYRSGDEIFVSYGPKSAADYLLEHGFCPEQTWKTAVAELTFELDPQDRFYDDKLDILEFETYDQAPMDPTQTFDVVSAPGRDGEPDKAMIQFVRLMKLGSADAFLLESIFRKEVWGFMELPVSEQNELAVVNTIVEACERALEDFAQCRTDVGPEICTRLRESETKSLTRTMEYLQREKEALDLKEYYQERRLKDLGLDSPWTPEDDDPDLSFGQTRAPGGADYDW